MSDLNRTARTGCRHFGLAVAGALGFLLVRPAIHIPGNPAATAKNLVEHAALARLGVALELAIVGTQALTGVWFYKLFRSLNSVAAGSLAAFALINSVAILVSAAFVATAVAVAGDHGLAPGGDVVATTQLLYELSSKVWSVAALFLWSLAHPDGLRRGDQRRNAEGARVGHSSSEVRVTWLAPFCRTVSPIPRAGSSTASPCPRASASSGPSGTWSS